MRFWKNSIVIFAFFAAIAAAVFFGLDARKSFSAVSGSYPLTGWAWSSNIGWISFNSNNEGVGSAYSVNLDSATGKLSGYAWSSNIGWINFNLSNLDAQSVPENPKSPAKLNSANNMFEGWVQTQLAYRQGGMTEGGWDGWIKMSGTGAGNSSYGVKKEDNKLTGYAWGGNIIGWISMSGTANNASLSPYGVFVEEIPSSVFDVALMASPYYGDAPLNGVDLSAAVSGSATGPITYAFYCNRSDAGTDMAAGWAAKFDNVAETSKTATDACDYATNGIYTAKVIASRGGYVVEARKEINIGVSAFCVPPQVQVYENCVNPCESNGTCPSGQECVSGGCITICPEGQVRAPDGTCVASCNVSIDCPSGQECISGGCLPSCPAGQARASDGTCAVPCVVGSTCADGQLCRADGTCPPPSSCVPGTTCANGQLCRVDGTCPSGRGSGGGEGSLNNFYIIPPSATIDKGDSLQLTAYYDQDGSGSAPAVDITDFTTWSSSDITKATVTNTPETPGIVKAKDNTGSVTITASYNSYSSVSSIVITNPNDPKIIITDPYITISPGEEVDLRVYFDPDGNGPQNIANGANVSDGVTCSISAEYQSIVGIVSGCRIRGISDGLAYVKVNYVYNGQTFSGTFIVISGISTIVTPGCRALGNPSVVWTPVALNKEVTFNVVNAPESATYEWTFKKAIFVGGSNKNSLNPKVKFLYPGTDIVRLKISSGGNTCNIPPKTINIGGRTEE